MVPAGVELIVDREGEVVLVQLDEGGTQLFAAPEGLVGKLVGLEFEPPREHCHAEVEELEVEV